MAIKNNVLRGKILDLLKELYPEGAEIRTVISVFYAYYKVEDIQESCEYLADKKYVQKKEVPHPYRKQEVVRWYKILPLGIDLLDGNIEIDPGITLYRE